MGEKRIFLNVIKAQAIKENMDKFNDKLIISLYTVISIKKSYAISCMKRVEIYIIDKGFSQ